MGKLCLPGVVDAHVHLREPGAVHKEGILSGTTAALAGGVVAVLDMPNNSPPIVDRRTLDRKKRLFEDQAVSDYGLFLGYDGGDVKTLEDLADEVVGLKLYLDETFGDMTTSVPESLDKVFEAWPGPGPIAVHAESDSIPVALDLAERHGQRLHVCHVPHPNDLLVIDAARQRGVGVTCEVTPHHLFLSRESTEGLGAFGYMKPPLVDSADVDLFWKRLDMVNIVASDHAPHTREEKNSSNPPPGVPGLETLLPLLLRAVDEERLTFDRLEEMIYHNPLTIYGRCEPEDTEIEVILEGAYRLSERSYRTRCDWSPFVGQWALGRIEKVRLRGETVWEEGELMASPGYGRPLKCCD
ncbi:MAG: amidohydrolase family protein [Anaerolineales bacterium]